MKTHFIALMTLPFLLDAAETGSLNGKLEAAASASGRDYIQARSAVILAGKANTRALQAAAEDRSLTWQQRLIARICIEWMGRDGEIEDLRQYDWTKDALYQKDWERQRMGPWVHMSPMVVKRFKENRLWYYYAEVFWKRTGEYGSHQWSASHWPGYGAGALNGEPEYFYVVGIQRDILKRDTDLKSREASKTYGDLVWEKRAEAIPEMLLCFRARMERQASTLIPEEMPDSGYHRRLRKFFGSKQRLYEMRMRELMAFAGPQHADLIEQYLDAHPFLAELKPEVEAIRKRPPVKELQEPAFRPSHPSEAPEPATQKP